MELYERIRELRKNVLNMSVEAFASRLGVGRDTINNIELNRLARPEQKMSLYKLICSEFNVNEEWLLNGVGAMFASNDAEYITLIDNVMNGENEFAKNIFKTFASFDESDWEALKHMIDKYNSIAAADPAALVPDTAEELEAQCPPVDAGSTSGVDAG